jgi:hypothetical protein
MMQLFPSDRSPLRVSAWMMMVLLALLFRILFEMLFRMLVTLTEHYWVTLGERRSMSF